MGIMAGGASLAMLSACGGAGSSGAGGTSPASAAASGAAFKTPAYVPFQGPKPDLPGNDQGLPPGYFSYPKTLVLSLIHI